MKSTFGRVANAIDITIDTGIMRKKGIVRMATGKKTSGLSKGALFYCWYTNPHYSTTSPPRFYVAG
jgi:hypothetical protein